MATNKKSSKSSSTGKARLSKAQTGTSVPKTIDNVPGTFKNNTSKWPSPRKITGGTKSTDNVSKSPWKSIDPVIPVVQLDWKRPDGKDEPKNKYGKGRKAKPKKNGDWFGNK